MRIYEDLSEKEKQKFTAFFSLKGLMRQEYNDSLLFGFLFFILGFISMLSSIIIGLTTINIGLSIDSNGLYSAGFDIISYGILIGLLFIILFGIMLVVATWNQMQDKKLLYAIFEMDNISKEMMEIKKEDLKNIKLKYQKVK